MCCPSSGWSKLALVFLLIGMLLHFIGWATEFWMTGSKGTDDFEIGLWSMTKCYANDTCDSGSVSSDYESDEFNIVRAFETIALCLVGFAAVLLIMYMCADAIRQKTMAAVIMTTCYIAGTCSFVGMVVLLTSTPSNFDVAWSLGLTVIAMTLILIAGTLMIPDTFEGYDDERYDDDDRDDFYNPRRRSISSPQSGPKRRPPSRSVTPISYRGGVEESRWRSY